MEHIVKWRETLEPEMVRWVLLYDEMSKEKNNLWIQLYMCTYMYRLLYHPKIHIIYFKESETIAIPFYNIILYILVTSASSGYMKCIKGHHFPYKILVSTTKKNFRFCIDWSQTVNTLTFPHFLSDSKYYICDCKYNNNNDNEWLVLPSLYPFISIQFKFYILLNYFFRWLHICYKNWSHYFMNKFMDRLFEFYIYLCCPMSIQTYYLLLRYNLFLFYLSENLNTEIAQLLLWWRKSERNALFYSTWYYEKLSLDNNLELMYNNKIYALVNVNAWSNNRCRIYFYGALL